MLDVQELRLAMKFLCKQFEIDLKRVTFQIYFNLWIMEGGHLDIFQCTSILFNRYIGKIQLYWKETAKEFNLEQNNVLKLIWPGARPAEVHARAGHRQQWNSGLWGVQGAPGQNIAPLYLLSSSIVYFWSKLFLHRLRSRFHRSNINIWSCSIFCSILIKTFSMFSQAAIKIAQKKLRDLSNQDW